MFFFGKWDLKSMGDLSDHDVKLMDVQLHAVVRGWLIFFPYTKYTQSSHIVCSTH